MNKSKLQIVRSDDETIDIYVDGKEVAYAGHDADGFAGMAKVEATARAVAKALGAEVEETTDPDRQLYRYWVTFHHERGQGARRISGPGGTWYSTPDPIEGPEDTDAVRDFLLRELPEFDRIVVLMFNLIDGPTD